MESLEILLERATKQYTQSEKDEFAARKNGYYVELIQKLTPDDMLPGAMEYMERLKKGGCKIAIGSSSKNSMIILQKVGLDKYFDAIADGNDIKNSKPDPEVFLKAAEKLNIIPVNCLVVEDADAGIEAALAAGMDVLGVGFARNNPKATYSAEGLHDKTAYNAV